METCGKTQFLHSYGQIANCTSKFPHQEITVGETTVLYEVCVKSKVTLLNIVIRGGSGRPAVSKMEQSVAIALH